MTNASKTETKQSNLSDFIKSLWAPITGLLGAVAAIMQFIQLWKGDQATVTYIVSGLGAASVIVSLLWVGLSKRTHEVPDFVNIGKTKVKSDWRYTRFYRLLAYSGLIISLVAGGIGGNALIQHRKWLNERVVILVANIDGPEEQYGVTNELLEQLNSAIADYEDVQVISLGKIISVEQGSRYARSIGERYLADVVVWGWYRPTDNPNITLHIENLTPTEIVNLKSTNDLRPSATLADLSSFYIQQALGEEIGSMVVFIGGYAHFRSGDYQEALVRFEKSLSNKKWSDDLINRTDIVFYISMCHLLLGESNKGISDIDLLIQLNPSISEAYYNRGAVQFQLGEYEKAAVDFNQAIQINPESALAYSQLGTVNLVQGEYSEALVNYTRAIQINPDDAQFYYRRALVYSQLGEDSKALDDYQVSLELTNDPLLRTSIEMKIKQLNPGP